MRRVTVIEGQPLHIAIDTKELRAGDVFTIEVKKSLPSGEEITDLRIVEVYPKIEKRIESCLE